MNEIQKKESTYLYIGYALFAIGIVTAGLLVYQIFQL